MQGTKWIAKGISQNQSLETLNIKGNMIGDDGVVLLAESIREAQNLWYMDIGLNEIGPSGFQALCEVLPDSNVTNLICNKNFLGDDVMAYFANILADP